MLSPKSSNPHCSNLGNCETDIPEQQHHHHRSHATVSGGGNGHLLRTHNNESKFQPTQQQHHLSSSSNINRRGSSSNVLPPHITNLSSTASASAVANSTLRRKSSLCYQQQLLGGNGINCSTDTLNDCANNDISLTRYSQHPNELFLHHQLYHQQRKPSLQAIERFDDSLACCLPPPSPAPNSDRFIGGTCVVSPPIVSESQHQAQNQQQQTLSSSTSNSSISTGIGSTSSSSASTFQPASSSSHHHHQHALKYTANQSINTMQRSISPSTTRFRINSDRYRDINSTNSSPSVNTASGSVSGSASVVMPSSTNRFVNLSSHFPYQNCTTPSLVSTDTYSYLASTVHTPVKRYVPTPPPPNQVYASDQQNQLHQQQINNIQTPTQTATNTNAPISKANGPVNNGSVSGSSIGTSTPSIAAATVPYRVHAIKCCLPDQLTEQQAATLNLSQATDYYSSSPRLRNSYNCNKTIAKDSSSLIMNFNESQTTQSSLNKSSSSTTQTHMVTTIMGCGGNGSVNSSSPPTGTANATAVGTRSQMPTYTSRNGLCSIMNDLQEPMTLSSTVTNISDVNQPSNGCTNALRSEDASTSVGISIASGTSSTCLHCKTVRRTTGVHQTTQTTGPISPVPQITPIIASTTTNSSGSNNTNQGFNSEQMTNIAMTLTSTPTESTNHLTPITPPNSIVAPSNRLLYKKLDISPDQMFSQTQMKANSSNNQILHTHLTESNQTQPQLQTQQPSSNLDQFLPTPRSLNQQQHQQQQQQPSANQPIAQTTSNSLVQQQQQQQQQQQRYSCKKRFTQYMRREVLRFFGIEPSTEAEDFGLWQGRQRRLALRRFGTLKTESELQVIHKLYYRL